LLLERAVVAVDCCFEQGAQVFALIEGYQMMAFLRWVARGLPDNNVPDFCAFVFHQVFSQFSIQSRTDLRMKLQDRDRRALYHGGTTLLLDVPTSLSRTI
jgi:hypothetical protein